MGRRSGEMLPEVILASPPPVNSLRRFQKSFKIGAVDASCLLTNWDLVDNQYMVGNVTTPENSIEQMLKGFASIAGLHELMEGLVSQVAALRSEVAELHASGVSSKVKSAEWLKLGEAAERLNMSSKSVRGYIKRGLLRKNAASRHILIPAEDVANLRKKVVL